MTAGALEAPPQTAGAARWIPALEWLVADRTKTGTTLPSRVPLWSASKISAL